MFALSALSHPQFSNAATNFLEAEAFAVELSFVARNSSAAAFTSALEELAIKFSADSIKRFLRAT